MRKSAQLRHSNFPRKIHRLESWWYKPRETRDSSGKKTKNANNRNSFRKDKTNNNNNTLSSFQPHTGQSASLKSTFNIFYNNERTLCLAPRPFPPLVDDIYIIYDTGRAPFTIRKNTRTHATFKAEQQIHLDVRLYARDCRDSCLVPHCTYTLLSRYVWCIVLFAREFAVETAERDGERLEGADGKSIVHREHVLRDTAELHHHVVDCGTYFEQCNFFFVGLLDLFGVKVWMSREFFDNFRKSETDQSEMPQIVIS